MAGRRKSERAWTGEPLGDPVGLVLLDEGVAAKPPRGGASVACTRPGHGVNPASRGSGGTPSIAKYYYYPGIHEPGSLQTVAINKKLWDSLSSEERKLIETTLAAGPIYGLVRSHVERMKVLPVLVEEHGVQLRKFDDEILRTFGKVSGEVVAEVGASDPFTRRVYESYMKFRKASRPWTDISERAYLNARALDFPYGN